MKTIYCRYCQHTTDHALNCPNLITQPKPNYYHVFWLETAINNFKNQNEIVHTVDKNMTIREFVRKYAKLELSQIVDI